LGIKLPFFAKHGFSPEWVLMYSVLRIEGEYERSREILELALQSEDSLEVGK